MDKNIIKKHLIENFLSEDKKSGTLSSTEKIQSDSEKINSDNQKKVAEKMKSYEKLIKAETEPVKRELSEKEKDVHSDEELFPGSMAALDYDSPIDEKFANRFEKSLAGHETTGNSNKYANVVQDKVWGGDPNFGKTLVDQTKKMADKKEAVWAGSDTMLPYGVRNGNYALSKNKKIKEGMKRLVFKKEFKGVENALRLIPESYKVNNKQFQMTDGNEKYEIRWEGNLTEGRAVILKASDKQLMNEDMQKMKHLMGYKSQETLGNLRGAERINEDKTFNKIWNKTKKLLNEDYGVHDNGQLDMFADQDEVNKLDKLSIKKEKFSKDLMDEIIDYVSDGEIIFDFSKKGFTNDVNKNLDILFNDKELLGSILNNILHDINDDIELEKETGDDYSSLLRLKDEVEMYLDTLASRINYKNI